MINTVLDVERDLKHQTNSAVNVVPKGGFLFQKTVKYYFIQSLMT